MAKIKLKESFFHIFYFWVHLYTSQPFLNHLLSVILSHHPPFFSHLPSLFSFILSSLHLSLSFLLLTPSLPLLGILLIPSPLLRSPSVTWGRQFCQEWALFTASLRSCLHYRLVGLLKFHHTSTSHSVLLPLPHPSATAAGSHYPETQTEWGDEGELVEHVAICEGFMLEGERVWESMWVKVLNGCLCPKCAWLTVNMCVWYVFSMVGLYKAPMCDCTGLLSDFSNR